MVQMVNKSMGTLKVQRQSVTNNSFIRNSNGLIMPCSSRHQAKVGSSSIKRTGMLFLCLLLVGMVFAPLQAAADTANQRSRAINVVFDDSGTMLRTGGVFTDRLVQARYAMEVFAAMLEERDTMRIYFVSDFDEIHGGGYRNAPARITIYGSEPAPVRVARIHNTITGLVNTPFDPAIRAYRDLRVSDADERWLVVLTDGLFNQIYGSWAPGYRVDINRYFMQFAAGSDVRIILLAIGDADYIYQLVSENPSVPALDFFTYHARTSAEILDSIIAICNRIFNRNILRFGDETRREFTFDIPMTELLVFAQGPDVRIDGIRGDATFAPNETVSVRYNERPALNYAANDPRVLAIMPRELAGVVASFQNIPIGSYVLDVTGARTVEIYFSPNVSLGVKIFQGEGRRRRQMQEHDIVAGDYWIYFGFVNEDGEFFESELLGAVNYRATVKNGGREFGITSGQRVSLSAGELAIAANAQFLEINTSEAMYSRNILPPPTLLERIQEWARRFWWLLAALGALLLWYILWGRKKRFPRYMSPKPTIIVETDTSSLTHYGKFSINAKTKWLPLCPETGWINASANGNLPRLKVKAVGNGQMELTNTIDFTRDRLRNIDFYINGQPLPEKTSKNRVMSCTAKIKSVHQSVTSANATTHTCSFTKSTGKKNRKKGKRK